MKPKKKKFYFQKITIINWRFAIPKLFRWIVAFALLVGAPIYLALKPEEYTPFVEILLSIFLFVLAYIIGYKTEIERAAKRANEKWLPNAESIVYRLITLQNNVKTLARYSKSNCDRTQQDLPELGTVELKAVKVKIKSECDYNSQRLEDIANQLEDSINDWQRFIAANCDGEECGRIFEAIQERQQKFDGLNENA